jgi:hypothetical protein
MQAVDRAEIERFTVIVMTGCCFSDIDFHFADRIDRHGISPSSTVIRKREETLLKKALSRQHFSIQQKQLDRRCAPVNADKKSAANQRESYLVSDFVFIR